MIDKATVAEWRARSTGAMHSSLEEYVPKDEFNDALDTISELKAIVAAVPISSMVGREINGVKVRNYESARALLEEAAS